MGCGVGFGVPDFSTLIESGKHWVQLFLYFELLMFLFGPTAGPDPSGKFFGWIFFSLFYWTGLGLFLAFTYSKICYDGHFGSCDVEKLDRVIRV